MDDPETDAFKRLDLRQYSASLGYFIDKRECWKGSAVLRHANGDKVVVSRNSEGKFVYYSFRDERDNGTIFDFIGKRKGLNFGEIRRELRLWAGTPPPLPPLPDLRATKKDVADVQKRFAGMKIAAGHPYLEQVRHIPASVLQHWRFQGLIRIDHHGNACFAHTDARGSLCGYEMRNFRYRGYASGATKATFLSNSGPDDRRLVICESAIDCLSHFLLFDDPLARFVSLAGKPTPAQVGLLKIAMERMPEGSEIVAATDADEAGEQFAALIQETLGKCGRTDLAFRRDRPIGGKDFNEILSHKTPLPVRANKPEAHPA